MNQRIIKEVRLLFWPWCLIVIAALLPLFSKAVHHFRELSSIFCSIGFFAGFPFLAALSLGGEFQQRTISLLLGQPVERTRIWAEKQVVLLVALAVAIPVFWFGWYDRNDLNNDALMVVAAWLLATISSATFWTLVTRSTLGGLALGQGAQFLIGVGAINLGLRIFGPEPSGGALHVAAALGAIICLGYSGLMLWLGWRTLAKFQPTGGIAGDDLLMAGPRVLPRACAELLRCRPTGPTLNLIRKELRLLRPLWLIALLFVICWVCIVITFHVVPQTEEWKTWREIVPLLLGCLYMPLTVMLAGCLSLGEERTSGTHAWHLTLPVSARRQWFFKLAMALGAGVFCAFVIPFLAVSMGQILLNSPFGVEFKWDFRGARDVPLLLAIFASFPAFWCACAVNGTVRAALWTLPVMCALCFVGAGGFWAAERLGETAASLMTMAVSRFQLNPQSLRALGMRGEMWMIWLILPTLVFAVMQSYRLFRTQPSDRILPVLRRLLALALVAFICSLSFGTFLFAAQKLGDSILIRETRLAIESLHLHIDVEKLDAAHPLRLTVDDLDKISPLSESTRQWLSTASITAAPAGKDTKKTWYRLTIRFANGSELPWVLPVPAEK